MVFQIIHSPYLPCSLHTFLSDLNHTFVGVGIDTDADKLLLEYNLHVANAVDLRSLAADVLSDPEMMRAGLKTLAQLVLRKDAEKPQRITRSRWDNVCMPRSEAQRSTVVDLVRGLPSSCMPRLKHREAQWWLWCEAVSLPLVALNEGDKRAEAEAQYSSASVRRQTRRYSSVISGGGFGRCLQIG